MAKVTIQIDNTELDRAKYTIDTETGELTAWNDRSGNTYTIEQLAPFTGVEL